MERPEIDFINGILAEVYEISNLQFTGIGLVLYDKLNGLPISCLRQTVPEGLILPYNDKESIGRVLIRLSSAESEYHDGFHLVSKDGILTHLCQYFSPPIDSNVKVDYTKGGRFRAAQYGSCLENVLAVGVIGQDYGPHIFIKGVTYQL